MPYGQIRISPRKWNIITQGSPKQGLKVRLVLIKKEKITFHLLHFTFPSDQRVKIKESEKTNKYFDLARELKQLWNMKVLWELYPSYNNWLFSPLLEQRFRRQKGRSLSVLYEQYETSYLFYVTLSFLCNIICYLISVFAFSLVTLSGATIEGDSDTNCN